jgi:hypothetical protein
MNRAFERHNGWRCRGQVFADRYHARAMTAPRQVRSALGYVLGNWRKHRVDRAHDEETRLDPYASGASFDGWSETAARGPAAAPAGGAGLPVRPPRSWLLRLGWRRHGLLDPRTAPG